MALPHEIGTREWAEKMHDSDVRLQEKARGVDLQLQLTAQEKDASLIKKLFEYFHQYEDVVVTRVASYREQAWDREEEERRKSSSSASTSFSKGKAPEIKGASPSDHGELGTRQAGYHQQEDELRLRSPDAQTSDSNLSELVWSASDPGGSGVKG